MIKEYIWTLYSGLGDALNNTFLVETLDFNESGNNKKGVTIWNMC
ncbi:hypothetical protein VIBNIAM115_850002 [Vibrio nigripulchritudo AM115]|nr:hypothetical protein VIBNIAM115_850002 [Vibrio nigripulchritudo AM115]